MLQPDSSKPQTTISGRSEMCETDEEEMSEYETERCRAAKGKAKAAAEPQDEWKDARWQYPCRRAGVYCTDMRWTRRLRGAREPVTRDPPRVVHLSVSSTVHDNAAVDVNEQKS